MTMASPLQGVRVLDFGRYIAGPFCTALLADYGAEVIRVERPSGGEDRVIGPCTQSGDGAMYIQLGRNKRGFTLSPKHPEGAQVLHQLVERSDVVVANLPDAVLASLGLDYASLRAVRDDIILVSNTAFGTQGPYAQRIGFDGIAQAMSGNMDMTGYADEPMKAYVPYVDFCTASLAAFGTLLALWHRERTGEGQRVQSSLLATALTISNSLVMEQQMIAPNRVATGNEAQSSGPSSCFASSDGWVLVQTLGPGQFKACADLLGEPGWLEDERYSDDLKRGENREELCQRMAAWCAERTTAEALQQLEQARLAAGEVLNAARVMENPHIAAGGFYTDMPWPDERQVPSVAVPPLQMSGISAEVRHRAPLLGEHTDEILAELGYSAADIADLRDKGAV